MQDGIWGAWRVTLCARVCVRRGHSNVSCAYRDACCLQLGWQIIPLCVCVCVHSYAGTSRGAHLSRGSWQAPSHRPHPSPPARVRHQTQPPQTGHQQEKRHTWMDRCNKKGRLRAINTTHRNGRRLCCSSNCVGSSVATRCMPDSMTIKLSRHSAASTSPVQGVEQRARAHQRKREYTFDRVIMNPTHLMGSSTHHTPTQHQSPPQTAHCQRQLTACCHPPLFDRRACCTSHNKQ